MFTEIIQTRFSDTDVLGHINNTMVPIWFEGARDPIFRLFSPELNTNNWKLILAKIDVSYVGQMFYGEPVEIKTMIGRLGNSSFDVYQELWQNGKKCAFGTSVMVHFDYQQDKSEVIPEAIKLIMKQHLAD